MPDRTYLKVVRRRCVAASRAVSFAVDQPLGDWAEDVAEWARDEALGALRTLANSKFWNQLDEPDPWAVVPAPGPKDRAAIKGALSNELGHVLMKVGYRPPPSARRLLRDARDAVDAAFDGDPKVTAAQVMRSLNQLIEGLATLHIGEANAREARSTFLHAKQLLLNGALASALALGSGTLDDVRTEYVSPIVFSLIDDAIGRDDVDVDAPSSGAQDEIDRLHVERAAAQVEVARIDVQTKKVALEAAQAERRAARARERQARLQARANAFPVKKPAAKPAPRPLRDPPPGGVRETLGRSDE